MSEVEEDVKTREISDKKRLKNESLILNQNKKRLLKHSKELTDKLKHNAILIGDSKVRHLENEMTANTDLTTFWRSGATLDNPILKQYVDRHISRFNKPIVILFFNTCHLTKPTYIRSKYVDLVDNADDIVNITIEKYREYKQTRLYRRPSAKIVFLECPFYSIPKWNQHRGHPNPEIFNESQERLEKMVKELNDKIRELNSPLNPPLVAQDMLFKIKKKKNHEQTQLVAYSVLTDGIHPDRDISKLWLVRINNFINSINL